MISPQAKQRQKREKSSDYSSRQNYPQPKGKTIQKISIDDLYSPSLIKEIKEIVLSYHDTQIKCTQETSRNIFHDTPICACGEVISIVLRDGTRICSEKYLKNLKETLTGEKILIFEYIRKGCPYHSRKEPMPEKSWRTLLGEKDYKPLVETPIECILHGYCKSIETRKSHSI